MNSDSARETHSSLAEQPLLLPMPQQLKIAKGFFVLPPSLEIGIAEAGLWPLGKLARRLLAQLDCQAGCRVGAESPLRLWLNPALLRPEGYALRIGAAGVTIEGHDAAGLFYGLMSLKQLLRLYGRELPCLELRDWPDFAARGVMLDISRDKVPRLETLKMLIDSLAEWKLNQLQLYTEHTFAYAGHESVWEAASPLTPAEILELDAYCREQFIELVPNQNSFGHMTRWLKHAAYAHLAETGSEGFRLPWSDTPIYEPFSLCAVDAGSLALMQDLYAQLLPHFRSKMVNIGADETFDLGQGRSREACDRQGRGEVYLGFLRQLQAAVGVHGRLMQFWGDIVLSAPELIEKLPRPCIALNWGYEANHPFELEGAHFVKAGIPYYVCPGTSAWNSLGGRSDNMQGNLLHAAEAGHLHQAAGYLITDWGDNGHWQTLPVSLPGFAYGAALAWATGANASTPLAAVLDTHVFADAAGLAGEAWLELGTLYRLTGIELPNMSALFQLLCWYDDMPGAGVTQGLTPAGLEAVLALIDALLRRMADARSQRPDAELLRREFALTAGMMRHGCRLALARLTRQAPIAALPYELRLELAQELAVLLDAYRRIWLERNRPGGLEDSLSGLEALLLRYLPEHPESSRSSGLSRKGDLGPGTMPAKDLGTGGTECVSS